MTGKSPFLTEEAVLALRRLARTKRNLWVRTGLSLSPDDVSVAVKRAIIPIARRADSICLYDRRPRGRDDAAVAARLAQHGVSADGTEMPITPTLLRDIPFWSWLPHHSVNDGITAVIELDVEKFDADKFFPTVWDPHVMEGKLHLVAPAAYRRAGVTSRSRWRVSLITSATATGPDFGIIAAPSILEQFVRVAQTAVRTTRSYRLSYCTIPVGAFQEEGSWQWFFSIEQSDDPLPAIRRALERAKQRPDKGTIAGSGYAAAELIATLLGRKSDQTYRDIETWRRRQRAVRAAIVREDVALARQVMRFVAKHSPQRAAWYAEETRRAWDEACKDLLGRLSAAQATL